MSKPYVIGVTGSIGTGKTAVAAMLGSFGALVIDADRIANEVISPGNAVYYKVVSIFGTSILHANGRIDRKKLAKIIFNDRKKRLLLNRIVHPVVLREIDVEIKKRRNAGRIIALDAPLLIEVGLEKIVDALIVVTVDKRTQLDRCRRRWGLTAADVEKRIRSQMSLSKKRRMADFIIDNRESLYATKKEVKKIWREIKDGREI